MTKKVKWTDLIGFDGENFVLGTHDHRGRERGDNDLVAHAIRANGGLDKTRSQVDALIARVFGSGDAAEHRAFAQTIVEPIEKVVPYVEMYDSFFMTQDYGELEDNSIPIEDTVTIAWETHQDGAARFVRSGFRWTRPTFVTYDTGIEVPWEMVRKAGWDFFSRQMRRALEDLARKRDERAEDVWEAALLAAQIVTISGGSLTRAGVNTVVKGAADIGMPVTQALINPGTLMDFADFTWPTGFQLDEQTVRTMLRTLRIGNYGGVQWSTNPHFATGRVKFSGDRSQVGWHQRRGSVRNTSDVDIHNKRDLYLVEDQEHAWYVGNDATLWEIQITA